jgi:hypothetical protein
VFEFATNVETLAGPTSSTNIGNQRKNHPLFHETIRWKSDVPLTEGETESRLKAIEPLNLFSPAGQLRSKRDEFWETAPAFDGRKEIWDALRAATVAAEALDFQLAQAILDGANIFLANGYLTECYDELGSHYKVPIYCLSHPVNIVKEDHDSESPAEYSEPVDGGEFNELPLENDDKSFGTSCNFLIAPEAITLRLSFFLLFFPPRRFQEAKFNSNCDYRRRSAT